MNKARRSFTQEHRDKIGKATRERWKDPVRRARNTEAIRDFFRRHPDHARNRVCVDVTGPKAKKLTDDQVREVRVMLAEGLMVKTIAAHFGVSGPIISYIKAGKTYRGVD